MTKRGEFRCHDCGDVLIWAEDRFAWVHTNHPEDDHAPRPVVR